MVYLWVSTDDVMIVKRLKGSTFYISEIIQNIIDSRHVNYKMTIETDEEDTYSFNFATKLLNDNNCNLNFFGIHCANKSFTTGASGHKKQNTIEDLKEWVNNELKPIKDTFDKVYYQEKRINKIEKDFV